MKVDLAPLWLENSYDRLEKGGLSRAIGPDDGYDLSDYYGVDPRYGTLGDFVEFTQGCKQRGIRVLIDLVVNHTSNEHPWFQEAFLDPQSKYREWYVWSKKKPKDAASGVVFPGDVIDFKIWTVERKAMFQAFVGDRKVLDQGLVSFEGES